MARVPLDLPVQVLQGLFIYMHDKPLAKPVAPGAVVVLSEPLDDMTEHWAEVPESSFVTVEQGHVTIEPFVPTAS